MRTAVFRRFSTALIALLATTGLLLVLEHAHAQGTVESDRDALVALYNATDGPNWVSSTSWLTSDPLGDWEGITTDTDGRVTEIALTANNLTGTIPTEVGNLAELTKLVLWGNELTGTIPTQLGSLTSLTILELSINALTGRIPTQLGNLTALEVMGLSRNQLSGAIPTQLGNLVNLTLLDLSGNELSGAIPNQLGNLTALYFLRLSSNQLSGAIPTQLGNLVNLAELHLNGNRLTGAIPTQLENLVHLLQLYLNGNQLTGEIPTELENLTNLDHLLLWDNRLTGTIPTELGSLTSLSLLGLSRNRLTGEIPTQLGNLVNLTQLYLNGNRLTGAIPTQLGSLTYLYYLWLSNNQLTGEIPIELENLANLLQLDLNGNQLSGAIPTQLGSLTNLTDLDLGDNGLTGTIPTQLGNLVNLTQLYLNGNQLTGEIPTQLGSLANLTQLYLSRNELTGEIPTWLGTLNSLTDLDLGDNELTGEIPTELGNLSNLQELKLNGNTDLTGPLPLGLMNLDDLTTVWIQGTGLCAPEDAAFRAWAAAIDDFMGCGGPPPPPPPSPPRPPPPPPGDFPTADAGPDQTGVWQGALVTLDGSGSSDPDDDPLRYRWNQLSGEPVTLSSRNVVNPTFTAPQGLTADAVLKFRLLVTDPSGRFDSDTVTVTVDPEAEPPLAIYYFPHLAVGAGWQTTITYINYSSEEVSCQTDFLSDQGTPLMVSFAGRGMVDSRTDTLPPGGSVHQETNVELSAPLAPGWARATCSGPLKASLLFRQHNSEGMPVAEAAVNAATVPATRFVTFAEQGEGEDQLGTAVAYANPSDTSALVTFTARDAAGLTLASVNQELSAGGHAAQNMAPLFGLSSFTGSLEVTSTEPIVSLSLNFEADPVFSSLPPGEVDAAAQGSTTYYFPHLAVGASWQTTITYINYSPQEVSCQTDFLSDHGSPLMVSFAGLGTVVSRPDTLPPGGSVHQETNVELSAPLAPGWARATCSGPVKASLLFRLHNSEGVPVAEAAVNAAAVPATRFVTFAEQGEGKFGTGVAYANPSDTTTAFVTFTVRDAAGNELARSAPLTLLPRGHDAQNMAPLFGLSSFTGLLEVTSSEPIVTLSLNFEADPVFSSLPPGEVDAAAQ